MMRSSGSTEGWKPPSSLNSTARTTFLSLLDRNALAGAGVYLIGHGLAKASLFICAGILLHRVSSVDEIELRGRGRRLKWAAVLSTVGALGLCGIPPFATFTGKAWIDESCARHGYHWVPLMLTMTVALTAGAVLRMTGRVFLGFGSPVGGTDSQSPTERETPETIGEHRRTPLAMVLPAALLLLGCLVVNRLPGFNRQAVAWAEVFQDRAAYPERVLKGAVEAPQSRVGLIRSTSGSFVRSLISLLAAGVLCLLSLSVHRMAEPVRQRWSTVADPAARGMRYLHSGHVGDYVVWQVSGIALIGMALAVAVR